MTKKKDPYPGMGGPAALARACGHADTTTVSAWIRDWPSRRPDWLPDPDAWETLPSGRRRPYWTHEAIADIAAADRSRRPDAGPPTKRYPFDGDPRLTRAREALAAAPDATTRQLADQLTQHDDTATAERQWHRIIHVARKHPTPEN